MNKKTIISASIFILCIGNSFVENAIAKQLETVVVTGRATEDQRQSVPSAIGVVNTEQIKLVAPTHVNELSDRIAGVWISRGNGQEHLTAIRSPVYVGAGSCGEFLVLQDGVPIRPSGFCNVNQMFQFNTEQAEQIEILKGPGSALYGSNALHGVINVLSPDVDTLQDERLAFKVDVGPHDYRRGFLSYRNGSDWLIDGHIDHDGGYKDDSGFEQQKFTLVHQAQHQQSVDAKYFLGLSNLRQETAGYLVGQDAYKNNHLKKFNPNPEAYRNVSSAFSYASFDGGVSGDSLWNITPYMNWSDMEFVQHWLPTAPLEKNNHVSAGLKGKFSYSKSPSIKIVSGFNLEGARISYDEFQSAATVGGFVQGQHYNFDVWSNHFGLYSEFELALNDSMTAIAGLRYDHQYYDYDSRTAANTVGNYTRLADRTDTFGNGSLNGGLIWELKPAQQFYLNLSSGFRAPQIAELYRLEGGTPLEQVDSVQATNIDAGWRGDIEPDIGEYLFYEMALFYMNKRNVILKQSNRQYLGDGETSHKGLEISLLYYPVDALYLRTSLVFSEHRYERIDNQLFGFPVANVEGNFIDTAPRHMGSIQFGYEWIDMFIELEIKHMGSYYLDPLNLQEYEGHDLINLRAQWDLDNETQLSARLMNLANTDYAERADVTAFGNIPRYFVGEPRALYISLEKSF